MRRLSNLGAPKQLRARALAGGNKIMLCSDRWRTPWRAAHKALSGTKFNIRAQGAQTPYMVYARSRVYFGRPGGPVQLSTNGKLAPLEWKALKG